MKYDVYDLIGNDDLSIFDFFSFGERGEIPKRIEFMPTAQPNVVNLAFGDMNTCGEMDDFAVSDNGDRNKVLATVASAINAYLHRYPNRWVRFTGSTEHRTRLYRMAVGLHLEELSQDFEVFVQNPDGLIPFRKNVPTNVIYVKRKEKNFQLYETENNKI